MPGLIQRTRPAHAPGPTYLSYTPNGTQLITVGANDSLRVFQHGSDAEPRNIDEAHDSNTAVVAYNDFFITGSEDGAVCKFSLDTMSLDGILVRSTLPIRDLSVSPDGEWVAVASDELVVKVVHTRDMTRVLYLREQQKPVKHVSFDFSGTLVAASCTDGSVYVYSISSSEPELVKKVDGLISVVETEDQTSSLVAWHPDGRAFAAPTSARDIQVISTKDWEHQRAFKDGHSGHITALAWSPNGALLVTAGTDNKICLWDTKTQKVLTRYEDVQGVVLAFSWHPVDNTLSYTADSGELHIHTDFVPQEYTSKLQIDLQPAPFIHDPLQEISGNANRKIIRRDADDKIRRRERQGTPDSLDDILGPEEESDLDGFIEDDDNAGYAERSNGKRDNSHLDDYAAPSNKRRAMWQPRIHEAFQPGSTPWRGNRRYLCLNLTGFVWTVDQDIHRTVTVEFYDREFQRDFKLTDPFGYDKACLGENGILLSCPSSPDQLSMVYYRPHEHWTTDRPDWRTSLPKGEEVVSIALSESYVVVTTNADYVRIFTLFGTPLRVYRQKSTPSVTCASWRDYVLTMGNGPVGGDGVTKLHYTIENVKRDDTCQSEDVVALTDGAQVQNVFFSESGDPYIYDSKGVLLVLLHWRIPGQGRWVPVLDTKNLARLASGRKDETYWPVAVSENKFYCIILKGGDRYPYFPRPLLNEFEFEIPLAENAKDEQLNEARRLEETFVRTSILHSLQEDLVSSTTATHAQRAEVGQKALEIDKILLQLLAAECVEGEEKGMKALEIVRLMKDRDGRMLEAAKKVASRFGREVLGEKITELAERRLVGLADDGDEL